MISENDTRKFWFETFGAAEDIVEEEMLDVKEDYYSCSFYIDV